MFFGILPESRKSTKTLPKCLNAKRSFESLAITKEFMNSNIYLGNWLCFTTTKLLAENFAYPGKVYL